MTTFRTYLHVSLELESHTSKLTDPTDMNDLIWTHIERRLDRPICLTAFLAALGFDGTDTQITGARLAWRPDTFIPRRN